MKFKLTRSIAGLEARLPSQKEPVVEPAERQGAEWGKQVGVCYREQTSAVHYVTIPVGGTKTRTSSRFPVIFQPPAGWRGFYFCRVGKPEGNVSLDVESAAALLRVWSTSSSRKWVQSRLRRVSVYFLFFLYKSFHKSFYLYNISEFIAGLSVKLAGQVIPLVQKSSCSLAS